MKVFFKFVAVFPILVYLVLSQSISGTSRENSGRFWHDLEEPLKSTTVKPNSTKNYTSFFDHIKNFTNPKPQSGQHDVKDVAFYNVFTSFVNQTRQTIPDIVRHGNFSMIQAALLFTIGAMAAGAATIVLEALVFRQQETEIELYNRLKAHHEHHVQSMAAYGPPPADSYSAHSSPVVSYAYHPDYQNSEAQQTTYGSYSSRKKRDTGLLDYPQVSKPYSLNAKRNKLKHPNFDLDSENTLEKLYVQPYKFPMSVGGRYTHSASPYGNGYPDPSNVLWMNRLGMKRKKSSKRKTIADIGDDDDVEYARGGIRIDYKKDHTPRRRNEFWTDRNGWRHYYHLRKSYPPHHKFKNFYIPYSKR